MFLISVSYFWELGRIHISLQCKWDNFVINYNRVDNFLLVIGKGKIHFFHITKATKSLRVEQRFSHLYDLICSGIQSEIYVPCPSPPPPPLSASQQQIAFVFQHSGANQVVSFSTPSFLMSSLFFSFSTVTLNHW